MTLRRSSFAGIAVFLVCMTSLASVAYAQQATDMTNGVALPVIPMGRGDSCVKDTNFMRRNHMDMLKHQRDETMLRGVRGEKYSLKECLSCHAVYGADAIPVTVASPRHFCRSCHDYAAVSIDCFQCHASRPETGDPGTGHQSGLQ